MEPVFSFSDFMVFTTNSTVPALTWPFDDYSGNMNHLELFSMPQTTENVPSSKLTLSENIIISRRGSRSVLPYLNGVHTKV